jgi:hypothetical protein
MARKDVARIKFEKFQKIADKLGMVAVTKGGWTKFYAPGTDVTKTVRKPCIAVPNTKKVTIVEFVNWEAPLAIAHPKPSAKTVTGQVNFAQDEVMVLSNVYKSAKALIALVAEQAKAVETPAEQPAAEAEVVVEAEVAAG